MQTALAQNLPKLKANAQLRWKKTWTENCLWDPQANVILAMDGSFPEAEEHFMLRFSPLTSIFLNRFCWELFKGLRFGNKSQGRLVGSELVRRSKRQCAAWLSVHCCSHCASAHLSPLWQCILDANAFLLENSSLGWSHLLPVSAYEPPWPQAISETHAAHLGCFHKGSTFSTWVPQLQCCCWSC